ncbi:MAG: 3-dehydroquinate synthase II [Bacteroidota bacterium]
MGNRQRELWFDGRRIPLERQDLWGLVNNSPLEKVVVSVEQRRDGHFPLKMVPIMEIRRPEDLAAAGPGEIVISERQDLLTAAKQHGLKTCASFTVDSLAALEESWQDAAKYDYALVDFDLPTNIPLELIIARLQERRTVILRRVTTAAEMEVAFGVLEEGSDGVLFAGADPAELQKLGDILRRAETQPLALTRMTVSETCHAGMGMRACLDTTSLMTREEGMLVGSTSGGGIFVCAETHYLPYMNLRPFRVNAGAVHSYVWAPDGGTQYLTDLAAGSKVLCVNTNGEVRALTIGRVKIEARPLLLIKGEAAGRELNVIVQDDWHIRLMGGDGGPRNATTIRPGDEFLAHVCDPGRHVGIKVKETIIEK